MTAVLLDMADVVDLLHGYMDHLGVTTHYQGNSLIERVREALSARQGAVRRHDMSADESHRKDVAEALELLRQGVVDPDLWTRNQRAAVSRLYAYASSVTGGSSPSADSAPTDSAPSAGAS